MTWPALSINPYASVFAEYDKNSDGIIDMEELRELLGALGRA